jgi:hypothetical protein
MISAFDAEQSEQGGCFVKILTAVCLLCFVALGAGGCAPPFSELQSAKLVDEGEFEIAGHYSAVSLRFDEDGGGVQDGDEGGKVQDDIGVQLAYGLAERINFRARYEYINVGDLDVTAHAIGFGPKFSLTEDVIALYVPVGFALGEDISTEDTWQLHPTILVTATQGQVLEFNASVKYILTFAEDTDDLMAFNLGLGISPDLSKYVFRPEGGLLINPGEDGYYWHFSVGFSFFP